MSSNAREPTVGSDWRTWRTASEWNHRLFQSLFREGDLAEPVTHLPATAYDLRRITGDRGADPDEVADAFVAAIGSTPTRIRELLSIGSPEWAASVTSPALDRPPQYFAYLYLTCYVAAGGEDETIGEGQFPKRLRLRLGHDDGRWHYQTLPTLDRLWEEFARWLEPFARQGECRPLHLPEKEPWRKYLSYSYQLAFPTLRERQCLADAFSDLQGEEPAIRDALDRMRSIHGRFHSSSRLVHYFQDFEEEHAAGAPNLRSHPFWTAVRDATALDYVSTSRRRLRLGLVIPTPGTPDEVLLYASPGKTLPALVTIELDEDVGGFDGLVSVEGTADPVRRMLDGRIRPLWREAASTALASSIRDGVVLFARDPSGWPVSRYSLPDLDRETWLLANDDVVGKLLLRVFPKSPERRDRVSRPSIYPGWSWVHLPTAGPLHAVSDRFPDVRCLQPTASGPALRVVGGVRVGATYLGFATVLPRVASEKAARVERVEAESGVPVALQPDAEGLHAEPSPVALKGAHAYVGLDAQDREIGRSLVRFVEGTVSTDYRSLSDPQRFTVESTGPETVPWSEAHGGLEGSYPYGATPSAPVGPSPTRFDGLLDSDAAPSLRTPPEGRWHAFVEVAAAYASRRTGVGEADFLALLTDVLRVPAGPLLWETARAWVEAGAFEVLTPTTFPARRYLARRPHLVTSNGGRVGVLVGLVPSAVQWEIAHVADDLGVGRDVLPSPSPWVASLLRFSAADPLALDELAQRVGLADSTPLRALGTVVPWPDADALGASDAAPEGYVANGTWSWKWGGFAHGSDDGPSLVRYQRSRASDRYLVQDGASTWCFQSRTWALLWALSRRRQPTFAYDGDGRLHRWGRSQAHLPVPIARALACTAGPPGPTLGSDGEVGYAYPTTPAARRVLNARWFGPSNDVPAAADRLARTILLRARQETGPSVPIPARLARQLEPYAQHPGVGAVCAGRFSPSLMPHVSRLASLLQLRRS